MKFDEIKRFINAQYRVNVPWRHLEETLNDWVNERKLAKLNLNPDFQRGHIWTEEQQIKFVEFKLSGGEGSNNIYFNCVGWGTSYKGPFVLVDGKQRLEAVRRFLNNEITAFGFYRNEYKGKLPSEYDFIFCVNDLKTEKDVLEWYIQMNAGGTPHTKEEIEKVKELLNEV